MLSGIGSLATGFVALFAIFFAYPDWKRREKFKARAADARAILATFYEGRQVLDSIRSPLTYSSEIDEAQAILADAPDSLPNTDGRKHRHQQRVVTQLRINRNAKYWERVFELLPIAKAVFDDDVEKALLSVIQARQKVFAAVQVYPESEKNSIRWERAFWKVSGEDDEIDSLLDQNAIVLRAKLSQYLQTQTQIFGFLK